MAAIPLERQPGVAVLTALLQAILVVHAHHRLLTQLQAVAATVAAALPVRGAAAVADLAARVEAVRVEAEDKLIERTKQ